MADFTALDVQPLDNDGLRVSFGTASSASGGDTWGWQAYDPDTHVYLYEGEWAKANASGRVTLDIQLPKVSAPYQIYVSRVSQNGWAFSRGEQMLVLDATFAKGKAAEFTSRTTTLAALRRQSFARSLPAILLRPFALLKEHAELIGQMVKRDIQARYRGSVGDVLWTILHPLLQMAAYFFVFGVVLSARFPGDPSRSGFVLYFLAGMLPWIAFSEALGRAPSVIPEHRVFVKKLVFPIETLPVNLVVSGIVSGLFALIVFLAAVLVARGSIPLSSLWLPAVLIPQILLTMGLCWFLAATGAFFRDLGQIMGFLLTLWFFLTPICYPDTSLPAWTLPILGKNPVYTLVRGYRAVLLEGRPPEWQSAWKLWTLSLLIFIGGYAWFHKLRKGFADVL